jgi:glycosyltransferase involved in cell wall biosynthesis
MSQGMQNEGNLLFISHNLSHPRCRYLISTLKKFYRVMTPADGKQFESILYSNLDNVRRLLKLGIHGTNITMPKHIDGIDIFVAPFWKRGDFLLDYHVPMVIELNWLKMWYLAKYTSLLLPGVIKSSKVVIAPNMQMLNHAATYGKVKHGYIIPSFPQKEFKISTNQETARKKLNIPLDSRMALSVCAGRLREIYGFDLLLKTWLKVRRRLKEANLYLVGSLDYLNLNKKLIQKFESASIHLVGKVPHGEVPYWIAASDVCLSQRTPGFPRQFYDIFDSFKLSEYAAFRKPIVAAGYFDSEDVLPADTTVDSFSAAILAAFNGEAPEPKPHFWEENESLIREAYSHLFS